METYKRRPTHLVCLGEDTLGRLTLETKLEDPGQQSWEGEEERLWGCACVLEYSVAAYCHRNQIQG
jgi:hypothetical protein